MQTLTMHVCMQTPNGFEDAQNMQTQSMQTQNMPPPSALPPSPPHGLCSCCVLVGLQGRDELDEADDHLLVDLAGAAAPAVGHCLAPQSSVRVPGLLDRRKQAGVDRLGLVRDDQRAGRVLNAVRTGCGLPSNTTGRSAGLRPWPSRLSSISRCRRFFLPTMCWVSCTSITFGRKSATDLRTCSSVERRSSRRFFSSASLAAVAAILFGKKCPTRAGKVHERLKGPGLEPSEARRVR